MPSPESNVSVKAASGIGQESLIEGKWKEEMEEGLFVID
jgi:hypothetical protein